MGRMEYMVAALILEAWEGWKCALFCDYVREEFLVLCCSTFYMELECFGQQNGVPLMAPVYIHVNCLVQHIYYF